MGSFNEAGGVNGGAAVLGLGLGTTTGNDGAELGVGVTGGGGGIWLGGGGGGIWLGGGTNCAVGAVISSAGTITDWYSW